MHIAWHAVLCFVSGPKFKLFCRVFDCSPGLHLTCFFESLTLASSTWPKVSFRSSNGHDLFNCLCWRFLESWNISWCYLPSLLNPDHVNVAFFCCSGFQFLVGFDLGNRMKTGFENFRPLTLTLQLWSACFKISCAKWRKQFCSPWNLETHRIAG